MGQLEGRVAVVTGAKPRPSSWRPVRWVPATRISISAISAITRKSPATSLTDRPECRFHRIVGPNALPMLCWKIKEGHQLVAVFLQTNGRLRIFWLIHFDKQIESFFSIRFCLCLPNVMQRLFGLRLAGLGQAVEYVHRLVHPTTLLAGLGIDFIQRRPEPHGAIANRQLGHVHTA